MYFRLEERCSLGLGAQEGLYSNTPKKDTYGAADVSAHVKMARLEGQSEGSIRIQSRRDCHLTTLKDYPWR